MNPILRDLSRRNNTGLSGVLSALKSGNPDALYQQLLSSNPQFASFVQQNQGKTPAQIAQAYGVDPNVLNRIGAQMRQK